jgi:hypothetical protein
MNCNFSQFNSNPSLQEGGQNGRELLKLLVYILEYKQLPRLRPTLLSRGIRKIKKNFPKI